jgi:hypothetical protein
MASPRSPSSEGIRDVCAVATLRRTVGASTTCGGLDRAMERSF